MKRLVLLLVVALVLTPALALAQDAGVDSGIIMPPINDFADVKAYGNQTAEYGTGVMLVDPGKEFGFTKTCTAEVAVNITDFGATNNNCWGTCGMDVGQFKFDASTTHTYTDSFFCNEFKSLSSSGMADMSTLGGVSLCATNANACGTLDQCQFVNQNSYGTSSIGTATSTYTGFQKINLNVNNY